MIEITMLPVPFHNFPLRFQTRMPLVKGSYAFRQGDAARGVFYVVHGRVTLVRHSEAGHQIIIHRAHPGETLVEASLFSLQYHCDCLVSQDSVLVRLDKAAILLALQQDSDFALSLVQRFAGQVQGYRRRLEILAIKSAQDRVLAALADTGQQGSVMSFAASIGLSHEGTYRALSALVKRGQVERISRGKYRVSETSQNRY